jgi:membrane-associated protease RseP (regulator of RpoE activity)
VTALNFDTIALLTLVVVLSLVLYRVRSRMQFHSFLKIFYFCMVRTKLGMGAMERWARRHEHLLRNAGYVMIPVGFLGMLVMIEELVRGAITVLQNAEALSVGVVLPIQAKGVFYVPFLYWVIAIAFIMIVHEFGHGIVARAFRVRVKSTGFAFLGAIIPIIPGAFVEIDEKHLVKQSRYTQLSIFAAGPFVNIMFGLAFWALLLGMQPASEGMFANDGMRVLQVAENSPAAISGLAVGDVLTAVNGAGVQTVEDFDAAFRAKNEGDTVSIATDSGAHTAVLAEGGRLGVQVEEARHLKESVVQNRGVFLPFLFVWLTELVFWLFILNLGVGLFNLVPLGPIDGGRMFRAALERVVHRRHARTVWHATSFVMLAIIVGTLISAFV